MKKLTLIGVIVIVLIIIGIWYANKNKTVSPAPVQTPQESTTQPTSPVLASSTENKIEQKTSQATTNNIKNKAEQKTITINNLAFSPNTITISAGSTVTWTNNDPMAHSVIGDNGGPQSTMLSNGQSYSYTLNTPGTYTYHCGIHPSMKGTVVVQ